jgi:cellobiose dehydrogenase (acceptor)
VSLSEPLDAEKFIEIYICLSGYVFPPLATSGANPTEYLGTIVSPLANQWSGFALSGSMIDSLLIAAWPNNGKIVFTTRYATYVTIRVIIIFN